MSNYETNPVGALQERFQSRGIFPQYSVIQAEGASHDPTFAFQVILGELTATGTGSSKKQAKHEAARALLDKLYGRVLTQAPVLDAANKPESPGNNGGALEELYVKKDAAHEAGWEHDSEGSRTLWVGGMNANVDEEILFELFLNSGPLEKVIIPRDKHTLKQRSFGFIVFEHTESVEYAIKQMTGVNLFGSWISPRRLMKHGISNEVNDNYLGVSKVDKNSVTKIQTTNIKIDVLRSGHCESANNSCFANEKDIDLKECDERCLKQPQEVIRRNGIKVNLITLEKSKEIPELDNNATDEDLQSSQPKDSQIMKAVSNELKVKSVNNNIAENVGQEEPGVWMENIESPQKCSISPEKLRPYLKNDDHQNERSRDKEMLIRFPENERGRNKESRSSRVSQPKNQHSKIFENGIDDLLNNCIKDVDFDRRSECSKRNSRQSEVSMKRSRSRRRSAQREESRLLKRSISPSRHGRERERGESNYEKGNASSALIGKYGEERERYKNKQENNGNSKHFDIDDLLEQGEVID